MIKIERLVRSFRYAFGGILKAFISEQNLRIHAIVLIIVFISAYLLNLSHVKWVLIILISALVISAELFNTAIEKLCDAVCGGKEHKTVGFVKDVSSAAVLVNAIAAILVGIIIFSPPIIKIIANLLRSIKE